MTQEKKAFKEPQLTRMKQSAAAGTEPFRVCGAADAALTKGFAAARRSHESPALRQRWARVYWRTSQLAGCFFFLFVMQSRNFNACLSKQGKKKNSMTPCSAEQQSVRGTSLTAWPDSDDTVHRGWENLTIWSEHFPLHLFYSSIN